jgi:hypothetical protein
MVAVMKRAVVKRKKEPAAKGHRYAEDDLLNLLRLFYFGEQGRWRSHLDKLDHEYGLKEVGRIKGISYQPPKRHPNPLVNKLTHAQVKWAVDVLAARPAKPSARDAEIVEGWYEYCLRVLVGRTSPAHIDNATKPEVRRIDQAKALVAFSDLLSQVIDRAGLPPAECQKQREANNNVFLGLEALVRKGFNKLDKLDKTGK